MKIVMVTNWPPNDPTFYAFDLVNALKKAGQEIVVVTHVSENNKEEKGVKRIIDLTKADWPQVLFENIQKIDPDIVHIQHKFENFSYRKSPKITDIGPENSFGLAECLLHWKLRKRPTVITYHGIYPQLSQAEKIYYQHITSLADVNVVFEPYQQKVLGFNQNKVVVIPLGTEKSKFNHQQIKKELGIENKLTAGMIGWWEKDNGFDRVVKIWPEVSKENPYALLIIAGDIRSPKDIPYQKELLKIILESEDVIGQETIKIVRRHFEREEYNKLMASFDILILPYQKASKSINLYQAYGQGIPVVAFDIPALKDSLKQSKAGIVVPFNNEEKLKDALSMLLKDQKLRQKLAERAKDYANKISWSNIAVKYIQLYQSIT